MDELIKWTKALVFLQVQNLNAPDEQVKPEIILSKSGLETKDIAELLGKTPDAVRKVLQRARTKTTSKIKEESNA